MLENRFDHDPCVADYSTVWLLIFGGNLQYMSTCILLYKGPDIFYWKDVGRKYGAYEN